MNTQPFPPRSGPFQHTTVEKSQLQRFREMAPWRYEAWHHQAQRAPMAEGSDRLAQSLDAIDYFFRFYLTSGESQHRINSFIAHHLVLCRHYGVAIEVAHREVFSLLVEVYQQALELELYECIPRLKKALKRINRRFFADPALPAYALPEPVFSAA